jgi:hypothetical protein
MRKSWITFLKKSKLKNQMSSFGKLQKASITAGEIFACT